MGASADSALTLATRASWRGALFGAVVGALGVLGVLALRRPAAVAQVTTGEAIEVRPVTGPKTRELPVSVPTLVPVAAPSTVTAEATAADAEPEPAVQLTALQERDTLLSRLEHSGAAPAEFLTLSRAVEREWSDLIKAAAADANLSAWRCYRGGCTATVTHRDAAHVESLAAQFVRAAAFHAWPGGKFRSAPLPNAVNETEVSWILFASEGRDP